MKAVQSAVVSAIVILAGGLSARAEMVANPMYAAWAKFPVGSRSVLAGTVSIGTLNSLNGEMPAKMNKQVTYELLEVTPEQVSIRVSEVVFNNGRRTAYPAQRISYPAMTEKGTEGVLSMDDGQKDTHRELKEIMLSTDRLAFDNKMVEAQVREYSFVLRQKDLPGPVGMTTKEWVLPQVPGGIVKIESLSIGALETTTKMQLSDWRVAPVPAPATAGHAPAATTHPAQ